MLWRHARRRRRAARSTSSSADSNPFILLVGGLRPPPPYTLSRAPLRRRAPFAWLTRSSLVRTDRSASGQIIHVRCGVIAPGGSGTAALGARDLHPSAGPRSR